MTQSTPWSLAYQAVKNNETAVLVAIVDHQGSVPGKTGALMVVTREQSEGTVGGGLVEHQLIELSRRNPEPQLLPFAHDGEGSDSICSGRQTIAVLPLESRHLDTLATLAAIDREGRTGTLTLDPSGPSVETTVARAQTFSAGTETWTFHTPVGPLDTLTIVGGGHVGLALSRVMATLPFKVVVLDDRIDLPTITNNTWAHATRHIHWDEVERHVVEGNRSWAVIMTRGHRHDTTVLRRLLPLDLRYLGMMGSSAKVRQVFAELEAEGISPARLNSVHAPIGVAIGSHSPEEIAISIAAEIIKIKNTTG